MASDKSLAAEIEATTERERTRLIAWLAEHQVSTGTTIDREMTADALMADFIAPRLAEIAALQGRAFEDGARWMRERAIAAIDMHDRERREWVNGSLWHILTGETSKRVAALPLQPEGERSDA